MAALCQADIYAVWQMGPGSVGGRRSCIEITSFRSWLKTTRNIFAVIVWPTVSANALYANAK